MVKVSVIVPVYNIETYLDKCLYSLAHQTLKDIQIIIVNDGSKDNSCRIIEKYRRKYNERIIDINKVNGGLSDARNTGLQYAIGEYVGFVDGDDYVDITMFEKMYEAGKKYDADLIECNYFKVYRKKIKPKIGKMYEIKDMIAETRICAWNRIVKKEILIKNKIIFPVGLQYEDNEYIYKLIPHINKIEFVKEPLYYYVQRQNSICHTFDERTSDIFHVLNNVFKYYKENGIYEKYEKQLEYICIKKLLANSFFRMIRINDVKLRNKLLNENWNMMYNSFPDWKKNNILRRKNTLLDVFIKSQNSFTYKIYPVLIRPLLKIVKNISFNNNI